MTRVRLSVVGTVLVLFFTLSASAAIDAHQLGARYDATQSNITFKVYSSRANFITAWGIHI